MTTIRSVLFFALLVMNVVARGGDDFVHEPTGVKLPAELLGFIRGEAIDHEKNGAGQGISIPYVKAGQYSATLTIANFRLNPFPTSIDDPVVDEIRRFTVAAVLARAKTREPAAISANSRHTGTGRWEGLDPPPTPVIVDSFIVYIGGLATNDVALIWLANDHVWQLRVTREGRVKESWVAFARALVQLSVNGKGATAQIATPAGSAAMLSVTSAQ